MDTNRNHDPLPTDTSEVMPWPWKDLLLRLIAAENARQRYNNVLAEHGPCEIAAKAWYEQYLAFGKVLELKNEWGDLILGGIRTLIANGRGPELTRLLADALGLPELVDRVIDCEDGLIELRDSYQRVPR